MSFRQRKTVMASQELALVGGRVITPFETFEPGTVLVSGAQIQNVGRVGSVTIPPSTKIVDVSDKIVCPGFVEVHIHGYGGVMMGSPDSSPSSPTGTISGDILAVARRLPATGITSFLPTLLGVSTLEDILEALREAGKANAKAKEGAQILGIHMEGPYFNPATKGPYDRYPPGGAIPAELARRPSVEELHQMVEASMGYLRMMSLSPEISGALDLIREMNGLGIVASGAHSFASYGETLAAVEAGMCTVTHMFNGMRRQDHREPGIIEASLVCDEITGQIIADGIHVHPPALKMAVRCKGKDNLAITTDNTAYAGMPNGSYRDAMGRPLIKTDEYVRIVDGPLYGSVMPMNRQLHTLVSRLGLSIADAIHMATVVPARLVGVLDSKGSLEPGKDADVLVLDEQFAVHLALCRGAELILPTTEKTVR
jgi:N-acetylglucosamine-6-phosphate deacetylase